MKTIFGMKTILVTAAIFRVAESLSYGGDRHSNLRSATASSTWNVQMCESYCCALPEKNYFSLHLGECWCGDTDGEGEDLQVHECRPRGAPNSRKDSQTAVHFTEASVAAGTDDFIGVLSSVGLAAVNVANPSDFPSLISSPSLKTAGGCLNIPNSSALPQALDAAQVPEGFLRISLAAKLPALFLGHEASEIQTIFFNASTSCSSTPTNVGVIMDYLVVLCEPGGDNCGNGIATIAAALESCTPPTCSDAIAACNASATSCAAVTTASNCSADLHTCSEALSTCAPDSALATAAATCFDAASCSAAGDPANCQTLEASCVSQVGAYTTQDDLSVGVAAVQAIPNATDYHVGIVWGHVVGAAIQQQKMVHSCHSCWIIGHCCEDDPVDVPMTAAQLQDVKAGFQHELAASWSASFPVTTCT